VKWNAKLVRALFVASTVGVRNHHDVAAH